MTWEIAASIAAAVALGVAIGWIVWMMQPGKGD